MREDEPGGRHRSADAGRPAAELWQESGRWDFYGPGAAAASSDRHDRDFAGDRADPRGKSISPTWCARDPQLPPAAQALLSGADEVLATRSVRAGVMRGREARHEATATFHSSFEDLQRSNTAHVRHHHLIFQRLRPEVPRGGCRHRLADRRHGVMNSIAIAETGEDDISLLPGLLRLRCQRGTGRPWPHDAAPAAGSPGSNNSRASGIFIDELGCLPQLPATATVKAIAVDLATKPPATPVRCAARRPRTGTK